MRNYKLSVPVSLGTMNEKSLPVFVEEFRKADVERVFICGLTPFYKKDCYIYKEPEKMEYVISYFKSHGFEVGVWEGAFGHGGILAHDRDSGFTDTFTSIVGADGITEAEAFCPLDENFRRCYYNCIKKLASMHPDVIMFDDDFRLNWRSYNLGCCCDKHLKLLSERVGEEIPRDKAEQLIFTGGENRYRSEWLKLCGETLTDFARLMREAVDTVDENIRLGNSACPDIFDFSGTDAVELAKTFAGKTQPFIRLAGAPYHNMKVQNPIEYARMQAVLCRKECIEIFTEGDVYPRPRYNVPSRLLEAFDLGLLASGETDGILKYMFDYNRDVTYEMGYVARHVKNKELRDGIIGLFGDKKPTGVRVFEEIHKTEKYVLPKEYKTGVSKFVAGAFHNPGQKLLSENAVPIVYDKSADYPVLVFGENARYIPEENLKNGAILDITAAEILSERGIDAGFVSCDSDDAASFAGELFIEEHDEIAGINGIAAKKIACSPKACVKSAFMPYRTPASYLYENENGIRFYVLSIDSYRSDKGIYNYFNNYHRQKQLIDAAEWLCKKPLPAVCTKNPFLYMLVSKSSDGKSMSVALINMNIDEILTPEIKLDKAYSDIKFLNCDGEICGNTVKLSTDIEPYGFAAFEVK